LVPDDLGTTPVHRGGPHDARATQALPGVHDPYLVRRVQPNHLHDVAQHRRPDRGDRLDRAALATVAGDDPDLGERDPLALPLPRGEGPENLVRGGAHDDRRGDLTGARRCRGRLWTGHFSPSAGCGPPAPLATQSATAVSSVAVSSAGVSSADVSPSTSVSPSTIVPPSAVSPGSATAARSAGRPAAAAAARGRCAASRAWRSASAS